MYYREFIRKIANLIKQHNLEVLNIYKLPDNIKNLGVNGTLIYVNQMDELKSIPLEELNKPFSKQNLLPDMEKYAVIELLDNNKCNVYVKDMLEGIYLRQQLEG